MVQLEVTARIRSRFDTILTLDDVTRGKPAPDCFLLAERQLGVEPAQCLVWEDAPAGIAAAEAGGAKVFHAGTKAATDGAILANGGRVLNVTALGHSVSEAQAAAYAAVDVLDAPDLFCRRDIGWREVARERG